MSNSAWPISCRMTLTVEPTIASAREITPSAGDVVRGARFSMKSTHS